MSVKVVTGKVRFSYAHVFAPAGFGSSQDNAKYSCSILIPKSDKKTIATIETAVKGITQEGISSKWNGKLPKNLRTPLRDGDEEREEYPEYKGMMFLNATSNRRPFIVDRDRNEILDPDEFYSGCWGRASINIYPYSFNGNNGVAAGLNGVQKLTDGERLGSGSSVNDFNDDFEDEDDF